MTIEQAKKQGIKIYKRMPKGFHVCDGALTQPIGYVWISKGNLFKKGDYKHGLLQLEKTHRK